MAQLATHKSLPKPSPTDDPSSCLPMSFSPVTSGTAKATLTRLTFSGSASASLIQLHSSPFCTAGRSMTLSRQAATLGKAPSISTPA